VPFLVILGLVGLAQEPRTRLSTVLETTLLVASSPPEMAVSIALSPSEMAALTALVLSHRRVRPSNLAMALLIALFGMPALIEPSLPRQRLRVPVLGAAVLSPQRSRTSQLGMPPLIAVVALLGIAVLSVVLLSEMIVLTVLSSSRPVLGFGLIAMVGLGVSC
jgi:hypothetical protein